MKLSDYQKTRIQFNPSILLGVATASYQIEGAALIDGKGASTWDQFCKLPGAIYQDHHAEIACDHYHRLEEDLDLLAALGVHAYRFSVSWPRVLPKGTGCPNEAGLAFYDRLIDGLLARKIEPILTLFHWDACQALEEQGGFLSPALPGYFSEYTRLLAQRFGDRVKRWITLNEPHAFIEGGLRHGRHAPGKKLPLEQVLLAGHHALKAHGLSVQVLRAEVANALVTASPVLLCALPATPNDIEAARTATFAMPDDQLRASAWWLDPLYGEGYPEEGLRRMGQAMPAFTPREMDEIRQPLDECGFNLYDAFYVRTGPDGAVERISPRAGSPQSAFDWAITPEAHYYGPLFAYERYKKPILITENGLSLRDAPLGDGKVHDEVRGQFLLDHLKHLASAQAAGVPISGYLHWSLLDNFEWNHGYRERFGLVHVDYQTQKRTPKESFSLYKELIASLNA